jgi:hypothetical protein
MSSNNSDRNDAWIWSRYFHKEWTVLNAIESYLSISLTVEQTTGRQYINPHWVAARSLLPEATVGRLDCNHLYLLSDNEDIVPYY